MGNGRLVVLPTGENGMVCLDELEKACEMYPMHYIIIGTSNVTGIILNQYKITKIGSTMV